LGGTHSLAPDRKKRASTNDGRGGALGLEIFRFVQKKKRCIQWGKGGAREKKGRQVNGVGKAAYLPVILRRSLRRGPLLPKGGSSNH